ncbi:MAG: hypothetical protein ACYSUP_09965 [Planctomycetota bacterium]
MPARYRLTQDGDTIGPFLEEFPNTGWTPGGAYCSDDHRDPDGERYEHSHLPHGFPFTHNGNTVTVQKSDWAWDPYYPNQTRISNSTFSMNCYAYAEDAPTVMFCDGWVAFTIGTSLPSGTSLGTTGHARKIEAVYYKSCAYWVISQTAEKNASSGVYRGGWLPLGMLPLPYEYLRKHK